MIFLVITPTASVLVPSSCNKTKDMDYYYDVEKGLIDSIKERYDPAIRPWIANNKYRTTKFPVYVGTYIHALLDIEEKEETMTTSLSIAMIWWDQKISWDPALYENITQIYMQAQDVWRPVWFITNSNDRVSVIEFNDWVFSSILASDGLTSQSKLSITMNGDGYPSDLKVPVLYKYNGQAMWQQMGTIKTSCEIDITYYPFDKQVCSIKLHWYEYELVAMSYPTEHFKYYVDNGLWDLINHEIKTKENDIPSYEIVYTFQRKPDYTIFNILFPVLLIAMLGPLVFLLPVEAGERVSYSITVLLTVSVYMTIISEYLPHSSKPMAFLTYELFSLYVFCALIVVVVIFTTKIHHFNPDTPVPRSLDLLLRVLGCSKLCKGRCLNVRGRLRYRFCHGKVSGEHGNDTNVYVETDKDALDDSEVHALTGNADKENIREEINWQDIARALDRVALYTFYFLKILFVVVCFFVAFGNKDD